MKTIISLVALFACSFQLLVAQSNVNVLMKIMTDSETGVFYIDEGSLMMIEKGQKGTVYTSYNQDLEESSEKIGSFEVTKVDLFESELRISYLEGVAADAGKELFAEFILPALNDEYTSVTAQVSMNAIELSNANGDVLLDYSYKWDGALNEYMTILELQKSVLEIVDLLKENMADIEITEGRYSGSTLFSAMEKTTYNDVRDFLDFMNGFPVKYFGQPWMFEEIYATWLTSGTPLNPNPTKALGELGLGFHVLRDSEFSNFPVVAEMYDGYWYGITDDVINEGALIIRMNGESLFNKSPDEVMNLISNLESEKVEVEFFYNGVFDSYNLPLLRSGIAKPSAEISDLNLSSPNIYPVIKDDKWGLIDGQGNYVKEPFYDNMRSLFFEFRNGLTRVEKEGKWGFINILGEEIIPTNYKKVQSFSEGKAAIFDQDGDDFFSPEYLIGFIDVNGNWVSEMKYEIPSLYGGMYKGGMCILEMFVDDELRKGYIDAEGKIALPLVYDRVEYFINGYACVRKPEGKYGMIDKSGKYIIEPIYDYLANYTNGDVIAHIDGSHYLLDVKGNTILDFGDLRPSTLGGRTDEHFFVYTEEGKMGIIDRSGKMVIPTSFSSIENIQSPLMSASYETKKMEEGSWFFINKNGEVVIEGPFERVGNFNEDVCWVKKNGLWGLIDEFGAWLIDPVTEIRPGSFKGPLAQLNTGSFPETNYIYVNKSGSIVYNPDN